MRIGLLAEDSICTHYRCLAPMRAVERLGHELVLTGETEGDATYERLRGCDVIHVYRLLPPASERLLERLIGEGAALVWDTDDDLEALPRESPVFASSGGSAGMRRVARRLVALARRADVMTTTTTTLAEKYRAAGVRRIEIMPNRLPPEALKRRSRAHKGLVIGWTAQAEHAADLARIPIVDALREVLDAHPNVRVETLGLDLEIAASRYLHRGLVPFERLQSVLSRWDVGIAPLADMPFNRARSNVKLKEYGAARLPWLASPIGPYSALGVAEGGRLVDDNRWPDALDALIQSGRDRRRLSRAAHRWAKSESVTRAARSWERVYREALQRRRGDAPAPPRGAAAR